MRRCTGACIRPKMCRIESRGECMSVPFCLTNLVIGSKTSRALSPFLTSCKPFFAHARSQRMGFDDYGIRDRFLRAKMSNEKNLSWCALLLKFKKNQIYKRKLVSSQIRLVHFPFFIYQNRMNLHVNNLLTCQAQRYNSVSLG